MFFMPQMSYPCIISGLELAILYIILVKTGRFNNRSMPVSRITRGSTSLKLVGGINSLSTTAKLEHTISIINTLIEYYDAPDKSLMVDSCYTDSDNGLNLVMIQRVLRLIQPVTVFTADDDRFVNVSEGNAVKLVENTGPKILLQNLVIISGGGGMSVGQFIKQKVSHYKKRRFRF